jgi:hypothetical protein
MKHGSHSSFAGSPGCLSGTVPLLRPGFAFVVRLFSWVLCLGLLAVLGTGCASRRVDWQARVGAYSYDDAVREMGPPEKSAKLSDGSMVADWITSRGMRSSAVYGTGWHPYSPYAWGGGGQVVVDQGTPDRFLRLTFDAQGKLASWKPIYQ